MLKWVHLDRHKPWRSHKLGFLFLLAKRLPAILPFFTSTRKRRLLARTARKQSSITHKTRHRTAQPYMEDGIRIRQHTPARAHLLWQYVQHLKKPGIWWPLPPVAENKVGLCPTCWPGERK
jgi:hypothetical protein